MSFTNTPPPVAVARPSHENAQRSYNRSELSLRPIEVIRGFTCNAPGSVLVSFGQTKVICTATIEDRVPKHVYGIKDHGWLTAEYSMLPGATHTRSKRDREKVSGRTMEIQRLIGRTLRSCVDLSKLGQRTITIDCDVIQADGGTRVASITGGFVALVDALQFIAQQEAEQNPRHPNKWQAPLLVEGIAAISVGIVQGRVLLDLDYSEDSVAEVDANMVMNTQGQFIEIQSSTEGTPFERLQLMTMLDAAEKGIAELLALQQEALRRPKGECVRIEL
ncbi:MAG: ribonuclease PH [Vampirovibrionales bacterium]